jgi:sodium transport system ATP-binding protein
VHRLLDPHHAGGGVRLCDQVVVVSQGRSLARGSVPELLQRTGCTRFEDAFVALAFPEQAARQEAA